jgi:succinate dehydrogenase / fumarate reductase flavoprotein subunit
MQGLADGYFVLPYTVGNYLARTGHETIAEDHPEVRGALERTNGRLTKLTNAKKPRRTPDSFHRELGHILWDKCGMSRNAEGLADALSKIPALREEFWDSIMVPGSGEELNQTLEKAGRIGDFLELAELLCHDALARNESCGAHFREEHQTEEGEAKRDDQDYMYVAAWEFTGDLAAPKLHKEHLEFEYVKPSQRSYK